MFNFERLEVWKKAVAFAGTIYEATRSFPTDERFGVTNQIRRAATSIAANIAEGSARSPGDFARFIGIACGSTYEVVTHATIARDLGLLPADQYERIYSGAEEIARMLSGLRNSLGVE